MRDPPLIERALLWFIHMHLQFMYGERGAGTRLRLPQISKVFPLFKPQLPKVTEAFSLA